MVSCAGKSPNTVIYGVYTVLANPKYVLEHCTLYGICMHVVKIQVWPASQLPADEVN
jgi:hypothetical protein